jgi:hypothetical protein
MFHGGQSHFVIFLLLPPPSVVYQGRKPTNLRVSLGVGAAQAQAKRLRVCSHAGACSSAALIFSVYQLFFDPKR